MEEETKFKATFNVEKNGTINIKEKWYKKAQPKEISVNDKVGIGGLTKEEADKCQTPFVQKLVGLFLGGVVTSCKVEEDVNGNA